MKKTYYLVNGITVYRIITAPLLLYFALNDYMWIFKWMLLVSFVTDAADGYMARKFKVTSVIGSRLDSIGDDLTVLVAFIALVISHTEFILQNLWMIIILFLLFLIQAGYALFRYKKMTGFHTYSAKVAAVLQGLFLISSFFVKEPIYWLFLLTIITTAIDLIEEIILVHKLPEYKTNVKGLWWILNSNENEEKT